MKLKKLLQNIPNLVIKGSKDIDISGICTDSKKVYPKNIFFAFKGAEHDGAAYIYEAISNGAVAIVTDLYDPFLKDVVQIITDSPYEVLIDCVETLYQSPSTDLNLVAVTGTNGKTTTSFLIKHIIEKTNKKCGLVGTNEYHIGTSIYPSYFTTPPLEVTAKFLKEMRNSGCDFAVMETSSHGLLQRRCDSLNFDAAIYTNLTEEHLDYHRSMHEYAEAKKKLFKLLESSLKQKKIAIINSDCSWHKLMIADLNVPHITYGITSDADVKATDIKLSSKGCDFTLKYQQTQQKFSTGLVGRFNVYNILAAICYGIFIGVSLEKLALFMSDFGTVRGRMEKIKAPLFDVFIDFAHTPNALENCLKTLSEIKKGQIITIFGCGGNRDKKKRPMMAAIAEKYSDKVIITDDNPRNEDPQKIADEIIAGFKSKSSYDVILDRAKAIEYAIRVSNKNSIVLIAGKGHETKQLFAHATKNFDDVKVVKDTLKTL